MSTEVSTEEQKGRILPRKDFHLTKFKLTNSGIVITHHLGGVEPQTQTNDCEATPHPDLINAMKELRLYMATRLGFLEAWDFAREHTRSDSDILRKAMDGHQATIERMNVNGITYKGEGDTLGVQITGSFKTPFKGSVGLAVPKINMESEELGYEEEVFEICDKITDEVYNYLILKKKEQTNIEDQAKGFDNDGQLSIDGQENEGLQ